MESSRSLKEETETLKKPSKMLSVLKRIKSCKGIELLSLQLGNVSASIIIISSCYAALFDNDEQSWAPSVLTGFEASFLNQKQLEKKMQIFIKPCARCIADSNMGGVSLLSGKFPDRRWTIGEKIQDLSILMCRLLGMLPWTSLDADMGSEPKSSQNRSDPRDLATQTTQRTFCRERSSSPSCK